MQVGSVTTGEPGTQAAVVNSGTQQNAVLDFTIPRGADGNAGTAPDLLCAFSNPPQTAAENTSLILDRNALSLGSSISHANNSSNITITSPGVYAVFCSCVIAPTSGTDFPSNVVLTLQLNGSVVAGGSTQSTFHTTTEDMALGFNAPVEVSSAPATLTVFGSGSTFTYSNLTVTVYRLGDIPS